MASKTKKVEHFQMAGMVPSARAVSPSLVEQNTERYPSVGVTRRSEVTKWMWDLHGMMSRLLAKSKTGIGAKAF